jgi:nicotinate-nucleotide adenylyltransferase
MGGRLIGERWGILGGTFDPVHYAHLAMAEQVRDAVDLDGVLFIPAAVPVHRPPPQASSQHRARMVELAIADNPRFLLSRLELDATDHNYSVTTLERLTAERPADEWFFIASVDAAAQLASWREPARLLELATLVVVPRLGYPEPSIDSLAGDFPGREDRFVIVATSTLGHSASDIRARLAGGRSIRYLVPPAVETYIREHGLYGASRPTD